MSVAFFLENQEQEQEQEQEEEQEQDKCIRVGDRIRLENKNKKRREICLETNPKNQNCGHLGILSSRQRIKSAD